MPCGVERRAKTLMSRVASLDGARLFRGPIAVFYARIERSTGGYSLFVIGSAITEFSNPLTPRSVTAFFEFCSHKQFHLFLTDPVFGLNITKANMIGQGHAYDLADVFRGECF